MCIPPNHGVQGDARRLVWYRRLPEVLFCMLWGISHLCDIREPGICAETMFIDAPCIATSARHRMHAASRTWVGHQRRPVLSKRPTLGLDTPRLRCNESALICVARPACPSITGSFFPPVDTWISHPDDLWTSSSRDNRPSGDHHTYTYSACWSTHHDDHETVFHGLTYLASKAVSRSTQFER